MKVNLPNLDRVGCQGFTACGELVDADPVMVKWLGKQREMVASCRPAGARTKTFVHVMFGGKSGKHVHFDVVKATAIQSKKLPRTNITVAKMQDALQRLEGHKIDLGMNAAFTCDLGKLPEGGLIRSASLSARTGTVTMRLTDGKFTLSGTPLETIRWSIREKANDVSVYLTGKRGTVVFDESYLTAAAVWIRGLFDLFVLSKDANAAQR